MFGDYTVSYTVDDVLGNRASTARTVTVVDYDECASLPCVNGGTCAQTSVPPDATLAGHVFICTCAAGWGGGTCATDLNECDATPCLNSGACSDSTSDASVAVGSYACACVAGFSGTSCEVDADECSSSPCLNGAACYESTSCASSPCAVGPYLVVLSASTGAASAVAAAGTCTGVQSSDSDGDGSTDCAAVPAFVSSAAEEDCPASDGCAYGPASGANAMALFGDGIPVAGTATVGYFLGSSFAAFDFSSQQETLAVKVDGVERTAVLTANLESAAAAAQYLGTSLTGAVVSQQEDVELLAIHSTSPGSDSSIEVPSLSVSLSLSLSLCLSLSLSYSPSLTFHRC